MMTCVMIVYLLVALAECESTVFDRPHGTEMGELKRTGIDERDASEDCSAACEILYYVIGRNVIAEGRREKKKKKRFLKYLALALFIKGVLLPKIIAFMKLLTAKAYVLSTLALVTAALITLKKAEHHETEEVINLLPKEKDKSPQTLSYNYWWKRRRDEPIRS